MSSSTRHRVHRYVTQDFTVRAAAVDATEVVREMQALQGAKALPSLAIGRAMVGAMLMAAQQKQGHQVGVYIRCQGPLRAVYAEAQFEGQVRGYSPMTHYEPENYNNEYNLKAAIGEGSLTVARHQPFQKAPHQGTVNLVSGEIGEDIAHYLIQSHQIRSLVSVGVYLDAYGKVRSAGGVIIEVMPGVEDHIIDKIQANADSHQVPVSQLLYDGGKAIDLVNPYFEGIQFTELDHPFDIHYACPCTKDRVVRALETLGFKELEDMIDKNEKADVTCQVCGRPYIIDIEQLKLIKNQLYKETLN